MTHHIQVNTHKVISKFLYRSFVGQGRRGDVAELLKGKKKLPAKNTMSDKTILQKWGHKDISRQKLMEFITTRPQCYEKC